MDNILLRRGKRRRRQCTTTSLISCALILIVTMQQQQQYAAATQVGTSAMEAATMTTTTKETEPEYANPANYDDATQYYYRTRASVGNEHGAATTYANYFDVIASKTGVAGSLITNHNLEELRDATRTTELEEEQGFMPTMLSPAGQHYAAVVATAATANKMAQNGYPLLLGSESFKLPAGSKIDYEINAGNYDDISTSSSSGSSNRALNERNVEATPEENIFQHLLQHQHQQQQQQVQHPVQRQQQHSENLYGRQQQIYNALASSQVQQKQHAAYVPNELRNYYNAYSTANEGEFPDLRSHYMSDYQMPQFSNYLKNQQQEQQMQALHADYSKETLLKTPAATAHFQVQANNAVHANDQQQQQQSEHRTLVNYANQQEKRQRNSPQKQQQQTAEPSQLQLQVTDSIGRTITPHSRRARGGDDIDTNDIDSINTKDSNNIINDNNEQAQFQSYYYNQQQPQQQNLHGNEQQQVDNNFHNMHQQLQQQRQQFAQLQLQLQQYDQLLQQQQHQQQKNVLSLTHEVQRPHIIAEHKLPPVTNTVHHSAASAAAVAGIPLGKHVQITKHVPTVSHYQQHFVPFKQNVPIEIPRPVITTVPRPYPIRIPVTKTVAVPQVKEVRIPIERIKPFPVERNIPYLVERRVPYRVEKQVATPYYYPFPIKVPVVKTIVHRLPHHYQHQHQHHHQQHSGFGGHSLGNSIYDGGHMR